MANINEMLDKIDRVSQARTDAHMAKRTEQFAMADSVINSIHEKIGKVKEIVPVVAELIDKGIIRTNGSRPDYCKTIAEVHSRGFFFSEGISHDVGFSTRSLQFWGVTGGGWNGNTLMYDLVHDNWVLCEWYGECNARTRYTDTDLLRVMFRDDRSTPDGNIMRPLGRMNDGLEQFVEDVVSYVSKLK